MNETLKVPPPQKSHKELMAEKAAAKEARLKEALRSNLRRRKAAGAKSEE